ncbi:MAG TPA: hypothetical protein VFZ03_12405, partial [Dongiaceae bacterium]
MRASMRGLKLLLGLGLAVPFGCLAPAAFGEGGDENPLQIYGLTLDETRLGDGFCETKGPADFMREECAQSRQSLPKIAAIEVETTPAPYVMLTLAPDAGGRPRDVWIWYAPREQGGRSFMISTETHSDSALDGARSDVLAAFGPPTVEFTHADMEARGIHVADRTVDTLLYVDHGLPSAQWNRMAYRLRTEFNPTGAELFGLTNSTLRTLARLLGPDFRGAIVQISESGWSHQSTVT